MSDIFHEVDEELRRERLKNLWDRHGWLMIAAAVLIVAGIGGWRGYEWWEAKKAAESGAAFESAIALANEGKHAEAESAFKQVADNRGGAYKVLARLRAAEELARSNRDAAVATLDSIVADPAVTRPLRDLAQVRTGLLLVDTASYETLKSRLEPQTQPESAFRHTARELLALSAWRAGDAAAAKQWVDAIMNDTSTPPGTRARTEMLLVLGGSGAKS